MLLSRMNEQKNLKGDRCSNQMETDFDPFTAQALAYLENTHGHGTRAEQAVGVSGSDIGIPYTGNTAFHTFFVPLLLI